MNSEDIRARIAELEAETERRTQADAARRRSSASAAPGTDDDPWERLFDAALLGSNGLDGDEFSLNGWLTDGLRGLRSTLRGAGLNDEFWSHLRGAERELLLACRVLIDTRLERLDPKPESDQTARLQRIDIEFDE
jgi:hypothetical protein